MRGGARAVVAAALAAALAAGARASAADLGIPRDGFDRVLLDDGRVVDARVLPREKDLVPLEFAAGTVRVHKSRVREVRAWRDFDPAPRDDTEKEKAAQGFVRWNGVLVPPAVAEKRRADEIEADRRAQEKAAAALPPWDPWSTTTKEAGHFTVACNASKETADFWCGLLGALSKQFTDAFPGMGRWTTVYVYLYRDAESRRAQDEKDRDSFRQAGSSPSGWDPSRRVDLVLGNTPREEFVPQLLRPAAMALFSDMMGWQADDLGGWVRVGVPSYFSAASYERGVLKVGLVDDLWLYRYRALEASGKLPFIDDVLRAGNEYWKEALVAGPAAFGDREPIEADHVPFAWMMVHTILQAEGGKYRGGLTNWVRFWLNAKIGPRVEAAGSYKDTRARLLGYLNMDDFKPLVASMARHAAAMEYRTPGPCIALAQKRWKDGQDRAGALESLEKGFLLAGRDSGRLRAVGEACVAIQGAEARGVEMLRAAVEADPLDAATHASLAAALSGEEAERERRMAEALRGRPEAPPAAK
jgi:hypothetical protein